MVAAWLHPPAPTPAHYQAISYNDLCKATDPTDHCRSKSDERRKQILKSQNSLRPRFSSRYRTQLTARYCITAEMGSLAGRPDSRHNRQGHNSVLQTRWLAQFHPNTSSVGSSDVLDCPVELRSNRSRLLEPLYRAYGGGR